MHAEACAPERLGWEHFFHNQDRRNYPGEFVVNLAVTYQLTERFSVLVDGQNLCNNNYTEINAGALRGVGNLFAVHAVRVQRRVRLHEVAL